MQVKPVALVTGASGGIAPPFAKDRAAHGLVGLVAPTPASPRMRISTRRSTRRRAAADDVAARPPRSSPLRHTMLRHTVRERKIVP